MIDERTYERPYTHEQSQAMHKALDKIATAFGAVRKTDATLFRKLAKDVLAMVEAQRLFPLDAPPEPESAPARWWYAALWEPFREDSAIYGTHASGPFVSQRAALEHQQRVLTDLRDIATGGTLPDAQRLHKGWYRWAEYEEYVVATDSARRDWDSWGAERLAEVEALLQEPEAPAQGKGCKMTDEREYTQEEAREMWRFIAELAMPDLADNSLSPGIVQQYAQVANERSRALVEALLEEPEAAQPTREMLDLMAKNLDKISRDSEEPDE